MKDHFVTKVILSPSTPPKNKFEDIEDEECDYQISESLEDLLSDIVKFTKENKRFVVFKIGKHAVGDFS